MKVNHNESGEEICDSTPMRVPVGFQRPLTLQEKIIAAIRSDEFRRGIAAQGMETIDEADDFDVEDDNPDPNAPWELEFDPISRKEYPKHELAAINEHRAEADAIIASAKQLEAKKKATPGVHKKMTPKQRANALNQAKLDAPDGEGEGDD